MGAPFWWDLHPTLRPSSLKIPSFLHHFTITPQRTFPLEGRAAKITFQTKTFLAFRTSISKTAAEASAITYQKGPYKKGQTLGGGTAVGSSAFSIFVQSFGDMMQK